MKVLVYASDSNGAARRLQTVIESVVAKEDIVRCKRIDSLSPRLCRLGSDIGIAVLLAANKRDLNRIVSIRSVLTRARVILVLPDRRDETIMKGHELFPRFLSYIDGNFRDVGAVLGRMWMGSKRIGEGVPRYEKCA